MALSDTDRRRIVMATAVTLVALPALWWANVSAESTSPNVAAAGVPIESGAAPGASPTTAGGASDEPGATDPVFLAGPSGNTDGSQRVIAVPAQPAVEGFTAVATFRSSMATSGTCIVAGVPSGSTVTVINLDNGRSVSCRTVLGPDDTGVVLDTAAFSELADLTDAPIAVEIHQ